VKEGVRGRLLPQPKADPPLAEKTPPSGGV